MFSSSSSATALAALRTVFSALASSPFFFSWDSACALTLAFAYLAAYAGEKTSAGALDFADLIEKTRALLASRPAAAWVLYKLDGGVDHILVDEAQDTAP